MEKFPIADKRILGIGSKSEDILAILAPKGDFLSRPEDIKIFPFLVERSIEIVSLPLTQDNLKEFADLVFRMPGKKVTIDHAIT